MEPSEKNLYDLVKENNTLLHKINRREKIRNFLLISKLILIIVVITLSYIYIQPYLEKLMETYQTVTEGSQRVKDFGSNFQFDSSTLRELFGQ